jgi:hypothetical protein
MGITFAKFTPEESQHVEKIVDRASDMFRAILGFDLDQVSLRMDLAACHAEVPLDLEALSEADGPTFSHDVGGIMHHMDRRTGELGGSFVPRTAATGGEHE